MVKKILIVIFILNFAFCSLLLSKDVSTARINLYVISFDNIKGDPEMDWLKEGFVDFIQNHFNYITGVEVYRTDILDETFKAKRKKKISGTSDFILSGGFKKEKGSIIVGLQLIDMNTYLPVELQEVTEPSQDLAKIVESVNSTVDKMLKPYAGDLFETKVEKSFEEIKKISKKPTIGKISGVSEATKNISLALDNLERSYSEFISPSEEVKIIRKQDKNIFSRSVKESIIQTNSLREVIENIVSNPYKVEIGEPVIKRTPLFPDKVELTVNILFHLSREVIREMLETLPYSKINSTDDYMEYVFNADQFIFDSELIDEISQGDFRLFPLISLSSEDKPYTFWLVDAPLTLKSEVSSHQNFFYNNKFSPLFNIIASSRNVHVFLLNHDVELSYCIEIPIDEMLHLSKMSVAMMSEEGIYNRISTLR